MQQDRQKNADRFRGFAEVYDQARPTVPRYPVEVVRRYLGRDPETVVDLGCGTGLSTLVWEAVSDRVIGVEPSGDMLAVAQEKRREKLEFRQAFANETGLTAECADAVICSQSFHWMEPVSTLREVNRILKPGGVFAAIDCDWPPVADWRAEEEYMRLYGRVKELEKTLPEVKDTFVLYAKDRHLSNIRESGYFRYSRELLFSNTESCTAGRFIRILLSQGSLQTVLKKAPDRIVPELEAFQENIQALLGGEEFPIDFCYRMRVGIK